MSNPSPDPLARPRLRLNDRVLLPELAKLKLYIATENWLPARQERVYGAESLAASWVVDVRVDENSGEDGAPAPDLNFAIIDGAAVPPLDGLPGIIFDDPEDRYAEGWYGNDAPGLTRNRLEFGTWREPGLIDLRWSAVYQDWGTNTSDAAFLLEGPVQFEGIEMRVRDDADAAAFLELALPRLAGGKLDIHWGKVSIFEDAEPGQRRWRQVRWTRAGGRSHAEKTE